MTQRLLLPLLVSVVAVVGSGAGAPPLPTRIVVAEHGTETELWAAGRLADLLMLPIVDSDDGTAAAPQIAVGHAAATAMGVPPGALASLDDDSFLVSTAAYFTLNDRLFCDVFHQKPV